MARTTQSERAKEVTPPAEEPARLPAARVSPEANPQRGPSYKVRFGRVEAAVWAREVEEDRVAYSVTLQRSYRDRDGKWQRTSALDEGDMLPGALALEDAYRWIQQERQHSRADHTGQ